MKLLFILEAQKVSWIEFVEVVPCESVTHQDRQVLQSQCSARARCAEFPGFSSSQPKIAPANPFTYAQDHSNQS